MDNHDAALRQAVALLDESIRLAFEEDGSTLAEGPAAPTTASGEDRANLLTAEIDALIAAETVDRYELEQIFSDAESETDDRSVLAAISGIWDAILPAFPEPHPDEYVGCSAEVTGDYGRLYFARARDPI